MRPDSAPHILRPSGTDEAGLQVDPLIQTQHTALLVEVKNRDRIKTDVEAEIREKTERFPKRHSVSLRTALVYDGGLASSVIRNGAFDDLIPFNVLPRP